MIEYRIRHRTCYRYAEPVTFCQNLTHLALRELPTQPSPTSTLLVTPEPLFVEEQIDSFGNPVSYFSLQEQHRELTLDVTHSVTLIPQALPDPCSTAPWNVVQQRLLTQRDEFTLAALPFMYESRYVSPLPEFLDYARVSFPKDRQILVAALDLTHRMFTDFQYDPRSTTISTPIREVMRTRRGVCQDFAHLLCAMFRSLGLACRYVSGYIATKPPPGKARLIGADATHAWVAVYCGEAGWVGLDPTNNCAEGDSHIVLGWGRDYDDVTPVKGVILGGGDNTVSVMVDVMPVDG
jgi:transglutaminase-like putative cysteine protease